MLKRLLPVFLALATIAQAQTMIPVTGTKILDNNGKPLASGIITFTPTNAAGAPVSFTPYGGTLQAAGTGYTAVVTNGRFGGMTIVNTANASPAGLVFEIKITGPGGTPVYLDLPKTGINLSGFSFDGYAAAPGVTITGLGVPRIGCVPGAIYSQSDAVSGAAPWVCSQIPTDGTVVWTQSPGTPGSCLSGQALASPTYGPTYCIPAYEAWGLSGQGLVTPTNGAPGPLQMGASTGGANGAQTPATAGVLASAGNANTVRLATSQDMVNAIGANVYDLYSSPLNPTRISGPLTNAQLPTVLTASTTGNSATTSGYLVAPDPCPQGQYVAGQNADLSFICGTPAGGNGGNGTVNFPTSSASNQVLLYPSSGSNSPTPTTLTPSLIGADPVNAAANAQTNAESYAAGLVAAGQTIGANVVASHVQGTLSNAQLANPSITVNGTPWALGGSYTISPSGNGSLPTATADNQIPLYQTAGSATVTPTSLTPALVNLPNLSDDGTTATVADPNGLSVPNGPISSGTGATSCGTATGCFALNEGSNAGTPTTGQAYIRADLSTNLLKYSINGGAETTFGSGTSAVVPPTGQYRIPISSTGYNSTGSPLFDGSFTSSDNAGLVTNNGAEAMTVRGNFVPGYPLVPSFGFSFGATSDLQTYFNSYMGKCYTYAQQSSDFAVRENICNKYMGLFGHVNTSGNTATWVSGNMYLGLQAGDSVTANGVATTVVSATQTTFTTAAQLGTGTNVAMSTPNQNPSYIISTLGEPSLAVTASAQLEVGNAYTGDAPTLEFGKNFTVNFTSFAIADQPYQSNALMLFPGATTYSLGVTRGQRVSLSIGSATNSLYSCVSTISTTISLLANYYYKPSGIECYAPNGITASGFLFEMLGGADMTEEADLGGEGYGFIQGTYNASGGVITLTNASSITPAPYAPVLLTSIINNVVGSHTFTIGTAAGSPTQFTTSTTSLDGATLLDPVVNLTGANVSGASTTVFTGTGIQGVAVGSTYTTAGYSLAGCNMTGVATAVTGTTLTLSGTGCTTAQSGATATATFNGTPYTVTAASVSGGGDTVYTLSSSPAGFNPGSMATVSGLSLAGCNGTFNIVASSVFANTVTLSNSGCSAAQSGASGTINFAASYLYAQNGFHHSGGCCNHRINGQYFDGYGGVFPAGGVSDVIDTSAATDGLYEYNSITSNHSANGFPVTILGGTNFVSYKDRYDEINGTDRDANPININVGANVVISGINQTSGTNGNVVQFSPLWYLGTTTGTSLNMASAVTNSAFGGTIACFIHDMNRPALQQCTPSDPNGQLPNGYHSNRAQTPMVINDVFGMGTVVAGQAFGGQEGPVIASAATITGPTYQVTPVSGTATIQTIPPTNLNINCQGIYGTASTNGNVLTVLSQNVLGTLTTASAFTGGWTFTFANGTTATAASQGIVSTGTVTISGNTLTYVSGTDSWTGSPYNVFNGLYPGQVLQVTQSGTNYQVVVQSVTQGSPNTATIVSNPSSLSGTFTYLATYVPLTTSPTPMTSVAFIATRPQQADCRITLLGEGSANYWALGNTGNIGEPRSAVGGAADLIYDPTDISGCPTPYNGFGCFHRVQ